MSMTETGPLPAERLTEQARAALTMAEREARALNHNYLGQEHLLLALVADETTTAARALATFGVTAERTRGVVTQVVGRGDAPSPAHISATPRARQALDLAVDEARRLNHYYIDTAHLLLGIVREGTGLGSNLLTALGVPLAQAREAAIRVLAERPDQEPWLKRYQLVLPADLFTAVQRLADRQDATMQEVLRRFIRLGLFVTQIQETPGAALLVRDKDGERQLMLL